MESKRTLTLKLLRRQEWGEPQRGTPTRPSALRALRRRGAQRPAPTRRAR